MIIIAGILVLAGILGFAGGSVAKHGGAVVGGLAALVVGVLLGIFSMMYTQGPGEAKVITSFSGEVKDADITEGLDWHAPFDNLTDYNIRNQQAAFSHPNNTNIPDDELLGGELDFTDKDGVTGKMDIIVRYSIKPDKESIIGVFKEFGEQKALETRLIGPEIKTGVKEVPGKFSTGEMRTDRAKVGSAIEEALKAKWEKEGVLVDEVSIQDIRYPDSVNQAFADAQNARTKIATEQANLEAVEISAKQKVVQAQADAEANRVLNESLSDNILKIREMDAFRYAAEKGNLIVTDGTSIVQIPAK